MSNTAKVALVTGAAQGIGRGIALRLAKDGFDIALVDLKADKLESVKKEVEALGRKASTFSADVSKRDDVYAAIDHAEKELGGFDVIVNNAGIAKVQPISDVKPEEVDRILKINVEGVLRGGAFRQPQPNSKRADIRARLLMPRRLLAMMASQCWVFIRRRNSLCVR